MKRFVTGTWRWLDDRLGISTLIGPSLKHLVPRDARWWYVFGSATMLAFIVQVVTGVALAFSYTSSASQAYETLEWITNEAPFGSFLRGMHYFGASAMEARKNVVTLAAAVTRRRISLAFALAL